MSKKPGPMMKFRVLQGRHYQRGKCYGVKRSIDPKTNSAVTTPLPDGDVVETHIDLAERFNAPGLEPKFLKLEGGGAWLQKPPEDSGSAVTELPSDDFDEMSMQELREFAKQEEIDVGSLRSKRDVIVRLRETMAH